ncbi:MAG: hydrogenase maturation protease [candidate division KSB1 bacterium]|nr:hydrogenase maturation protease [candidate division KSB1 bacterium]MDZ7274295.1 hydrogenase maturation protease [candidate division KSB1 bacterium]MDZ7287183.1 hydrogenase maturation protease [candidate division KSB1 bacterium]MDZ7296892.1 hydrogenase maturation protease [candidate division KSB1 bacterium]MDZ7309320.1 hydrogenase maturation protease [candidate division KSB1 bacterium]
MAHESPTCQRALVLGVGNEYRGDDAVGILLCRLLAPQAPPHVAVVEHNGDGTALLEAWQGAELVIVLDAVQSGAPAGTIFRCDAALQAIPAQLFHYSTHAFSLAGAIELGRALHRLPRHLIVYGIEGVNFTPGAPLSAAVAQAMPGVLAQVMRDLHLFAPAHQPEIPALQPLTF